MTIMIMSVQYGTSWSCPDILWFSCLTISISPPSSQKNLEEVSVWEFQNEVLHVPINFDNVLVSVGSDDWKNSISKEWHKSTTPIM